MPSTKVRTKLFFFTCHGAASNYPSLEKATKAAEVYSLDRGYPVEAFHCDACKLYHIRQSTAPREIPEEDRWTPARHRALRERIKAENQARDAEKERLREEKRALQEQEKQLARLLKEKETVPCRKVRTVRTRATGLTPKELRDQRREAGLCTQCGASAAPGKRHCEKHRAHYRNISAERRQQRKAIREATLPSSPASVASEAQGGTMASRPVTCIAKLSVRDFVGDVPDL